MNLAFKLNLKTPRQFIAFLLCVCLPIGFAQADSKNSAAKSSAETKDAAASGNKAEKKMPDARPTPESLEQLMMLAGNWEGTHGEEKILLSYTKTSGGHTLEEHLAVGTPHEMLTTYSADNNDIIVTHYCALGNQPRFKLSKSDGKTFKFDFLDGTNIGFKDPHMHALTTTIIDADHFKQEWTYYVDGKEKSKEVFSYTRKS